jgi:subtilisin family serine protease
MAVAGIAAGDELGNSGKHEHRGGAWAAKIVCHDAGDLKPRPPFTTLETLQHMLEESKRSGATIHNLSWGSGDVYNQHNREIDQFSFENEEQLVIGAGNNTNFDGLRNDGPAISYNAIGVAAANFWPDQNDIGSGKDGPTADGRRKPDLMAVGGGILTAMLAPTSPSEDVFCDTELIETATSFATPHVAAAAALVRQYFTEGWYPKGKPLRDRINTTPSGTLIKAVLLNSTVNMVGPPGYPSDAEGWGIIQLDRTLFFEGGKRKLIVKDIPLSAGLRFPDVRTYQFSVSDESEQLKITFGWTNRPPSEPSRPQVDGIRFEVEDSGGGFYFGNDMDTTTGVSRKLPVPPLVTDRVNNVQMVIVNNPVGGTWTIRLRAVGHREKQGYALVVSGGVS